MDCFSGVGSLPYKDPVGCHFRHIIGKDAHAPGFYMHLAPDEVFFGAGIWKAPNPELHKIRTAIVRNPERWEKVIKNRSLVKRFGGVDGEGLKRPPKGFDSDHTHIQDLKRKTFLSFRLLNPLQRQSRNSSRRWGRLFRLRVRS